MDPERLLQLCHEFGLRNVRRMGANIMASCPSGTHLDRKPSWGISVNGDHPFGCMSCKYSGNIVTFLREIGSWDDRKISEVVLRSGYQARTPMGTALDELLNKPEEAGAAVLESEMLYAYAESPISTTYCKLRGIAPEVTRELGLLYDSREHRLVIPWYIGDQLVFVSGRNLDPNKARRSGKMFTYSDGVLKRKVVYLPARKLSVPQVILVEGELDAAKIYAAGYSNVAAMGTSGMSKSQYSMLEALGARSFRVWFDADKAGREGAQKLYNGFSKLKVPTDLVQTPRGRKDPGSCTLLEICQALGSSGDTLFL